MAYVSSNITIQQCCNFQTTANIQQNNDYLINIIGNGNNSSNGNDDNDNNGNSSSIHDSNEYKLNKCKAQCDAQWKSDFNVGFICQIFIRLILQEIN